MKRINKLIIAAAFLAFSGMPLAGAAENEAKSYTGSTQFEQMKTLVGTWQGTSSRNKDDKVTVKYHLTSGGSAIVETLFPGAPYEMITVYHDQKGRLAMSHYCSLKNQPRMKLKGADNGELNFGYTGGANIDPKKDAHMHGLKLAFVNKDKIIQKWTVYENGRTAEINTLTLSRVQ